MSDELKEAFGRPIEGEVPRYTEGMPEQDDPARFLEALDELLNAEGVTGVVWHQYTPYFNDGDACTFGVYGGGVLLADSEDDDPVEVYSLDDGPIKNALRAFERVLESGQHYAVLSEKFGDPAEVKATKEGFAVEFYDHD